MTFCLLMILMVIVVTVLVEVAVAGFITWLYLCACSLLFRINHQEDYDLSNPDFFQAGQEEERFEEDFEAYLARDPLLQALKFFHCWPIELGLSLQRRVRQLCQWNEKK